MSCGVININNYSITGDCTNLGLGSISFTITGGSPNYTVSEFTTSGLLPTSANTTSYFANGLTAGSYTLIIVDSCLELPLTERYVQFTISSGTCVSIESNGTTCGLNNGSITANTTNFYGNSFYYLYETTNGYITSGDNTNNIFNNLSPGFYYVIGDDGGGCTGRSEVCLIKETNTLDFGLYVVNDASCVSINGTGKIFVTGLTGNPPYTYNWSPNVIGQTGPEITGLTSGTYTVTITDFEGCTLTKSTILSDVPNLGVAAMLTTSQPSCFSNDGEVEVIVSGGTAPYYFSGSNGQISIQYSNTYTFTGLSSGVFNVFVTDAGLCTTTQNVSLITPNGFIVTTMSVTNSNCNSSDGSVHIELNNGLSPGNYEYTLIDPYGNQTVQTTNSIADFNGLESGNYTILIKDIPNNSRCIYTGYFTVINENLYEISVSYSNTTCGFNNGTAIITATPGGVLPLTYTLSGGTPVATTSQLTNTFNNLSPGFYLATVTDSGVPACSQTELFYISSSQSLNFNLVGIQPVLGNDGEIFLNITSGNPPFTINWSSNVGSQTGLHITGLSNGSYSVTVIDNDGCLKSETISLKGTEITNSYGSYTICSDDFVNTGKYGKRGILQMMNEGFFDLTSGNSGCVIVNASFTTQIEIDGIIKEDLFYIYSGGSFANYADIIWTQSLKDTLKKYPEIGEVIIDISKNKITITNKCNEKIKDCQLTNFNNLGDTNVKINLLIEYLITCKDCGKKPDCIGFGAEMELNNCGGFGAEMVLNSCGDFDAEIDLICNCWLLLARIGDRGATGTTFNYIDCNNVSQILVLGPGESANICSLYEPIVISDIGSVSLSPLICQEGICTYPTEPVFIGTCDIISNFAGDEIIRAYFPSTNTNAILNGFLSGPIVFNGGDIAHTTDKMWVSKSTTSAITEYDIVLSPFSGVYNRDITFNNYVIGAGLTAIDNTKLITTTGTTSTSDPQTIVEVDISGPSPILTNKFNLPSNRRISGDIIYTTTNKLIVTTEIILTTDRYISQYDYLTGTLEVDKLISPTIPAPFGLYTDSGKINITDVGGNIYSIDDLPPYNLTFIQNAGINFGGASQQPKCETVDFKL